MNPILNLKKIIVPIVAIFLVSYPALAMVATTTSTTATHTPYASTLTIPTISTLGITTQVGADVNATSGPHAIFVNIPTPYTNLFTYIHGDTITATTTYSPYTGHIMNNGSLLNHTATTTGSTNATTTASSTSSSVSTATTTATSTGSTSSNATTTATSTVGKIIGGGGSTGGGSTSTSTATTTTSGGTTTGGGGAYSTGSVITSGGGSTGNASVVTTSSSGGGGSLGSGSLNMTNGGQLINSISGVPLVGQVLGASATNPELFGVGGGEGDLSMPNTGFGDTSNSFIMLIISTLLMMSSGIYLTRRALVSTS